MVARWSPPGVNGNIGEEGDWRRNETVGIGDLPSLDWRKALHGTGQRTATPSGARLSTMSEWRQDKRLPCGGNPAAHVRAHSRYQGTGASRHHPRPAVTVRRTASPWVPRRAVATEMACSTFHLSSRTESARKGGWGGFPSPVSVSSCNRVVSGNVRAQRPACSVSNNAPRML